MLVCNGANRLRHVVTVAEGSIDRSPFPVREILQAVLRHDGKAFAVAHNHPSGDPTPSEADVEATRAIAEAARSVRVRFLDHVVVGVDAWASTTPTLRTHG